MIGGTSGSHPCPRGAVDFRVGGSVHVLPCPEEVQEEGEEAAGLNGYQPGVIAAHRHW
jgi:hypothetical protein